MTLRHMKIFLAVCGSGCSVTGAAKELFMSQPSVTIAIREIEEHYGVRLFDRIGRRLYLTPAGEQFRDYAQRILALQEDLDKSMEKNAVAGSMRIGASMTVGSRRMPEYVRRYLETRETLQTDSVRVIVAPSRELEEKLLSNELDLALVEIPVHSDALTVTKYMEDTLEIIAPAEYGGAEGACCGRLRSESVFFIAEVDDGGGAADRHGSEIDRFRCLDVADLVVVEDFQDAGVGHAVDSLGDFIVVDEDEVFSRGVFKIFRHFEAEALEDEGRLRIEVAGSGSLGAACFQCVFQCGISDCRADGISVRIFMSDNVSHFILLNHIFKTFYTDRFFRSILL